MMKREKKTVREFDRISCNEKFEPHISQEAFNELKAFIYAFSGDEEHADAMQFLKPSGRTGVGETITVSKYVGVIQTKRCQLEVLPKIDFSPEEQDGDSRQTKRVFLRMLRSLKSFNSKVFNEADLMMGRMPLYEVFIRMYLLEVQALVKRGLKSAYVVREDNLKFFKGKLMVNEQIKMNNAHGERFFVRYDEYLLDRAENRLIKSTLLKLMRHSESADNQREIRQLLTAFEMVQPSLNYPKDFSKVVIDRSTRDYERLMRWTRVFLFNNSFTTFSGEDDAKALLFPMDKLFESYVAQQLKTALLRSGLNWRVSTQDKGKYLFDDPERFALRPDIVLTRPDSIVILDTKWKKLTDNPKKNYNISQADMYQMYAYAKKYVTNDIWLLYPLNSEMREREKNGKPEICYKSSDGVQVRLFFVDVANIEKSLEELIKRIDQIGLSKV